MMRNKAVVTVGLALLFAVIVGWSQVVKSNADSQSLDIAKAGVEGNLGSPVDSGAVSSQPDIAGEPSGELARKQSGEETLRRERELMPDRTLQP